MPFVKGNFNLFSHNAKKQDVRQHQSVYTLLFDTYIVLINIGADFIHQLLAFGSRGGIPFIESIENGSFQIRLLYSGFRRMQ